MNTTIIHVFGTGLAKKTCDDWIPTIDHNRTTTIYYRQYYLHFRVSLTSNRWCAWASIQSCCSAILPRCAKDACGRSGSQWISRVLFRVFSICPCLHVTCFAYLLRFILELYYKYCFQHWERARVLWWHWWHDVHWHSIDGAFPVRTKIVCVLVSGIVRSALGVSHMRFHASWLIMNHDSNCVSSWFPNSNSACRNIIVPYSTYCST